MVTVLAANLCGFLPRINDAMSADTSVAHITDTVDFVYKTVSKYGGIVASYHGDHFIVTFNAVKVCGSHALSAARAGTVLTDGADAIGFGAALRVGIATGRCHVGNLGNKEIKAFTTAGAAYQHACVLERMGRIYGEPDERSVLTTRRTCADIATTFRFRFVDIVPLPGRERGGGGATITPIATLLWPAASRADKPGGGNAEDDDEWLYVVNDNASADPNGLWNEAFAMLISDDVPAARKLVEEYRAKNRSGGTSMRSDGVSAPADIPGSTSQEDPSPAFKVTLTAASPATSPQQTGLTAADPRFGSFEIHERSLRDNRMRREAPNDAEFKAFYSLCEQDTTERFRDLGDFYTAAYSV